VTRRACHPGGTNSFNYFRLRSGGPCRESDVGFEGNEFGSERGVPVVSPIGAFDPAPLAKTLLYQSVLLGVGHIPE
jgi:hypothetical protein